MGGEEERDGRAEGVMRGAERRRDRGCKGDEERGGQVVEGVVCDGLHRTTG